MQGYHAEQSARSKGARLSPLDLVKSLQALDMNLTTQNPSQTWFHKAVC